MLKRWQQLAEPSLSSCLQKTPGVYTRAEILQNVPEENEADERNFFKEDLCFLPSPIVHFVPDPDDDEFEPTTPPSSPTHAPQLQTNVLLQQVLQRLVSLSLRTFETVATSLATSKFDTDEEDFNCERRQTITPPSSPKFEGPAAPTPNTTMRALKSSTFLRVSSLNPLAKAIACRSPGDIPTYVNDFLRGSRTKT